MADEPAIDQIERARLADVSSMVVVGVDFETSLLAAEIAALEEGVYAAVGIHPNAAAELDETAIDDLRDLAAAPDVVAIGETGMDHYREGAPAEIQERAFRAHIALAKELDLALVVHARDAHDDTKRILADEGPPPRLVMHCFSGDESDGRDYLELGAWLSFAGPVTFQNAHVLRAAAAELPIERMLVETDSPFLSPHPFRGKPNEPARVALVGEALAELKGLAVAEVAEVTTANAVELFGRDG